MEEFNRVLVVEGYSDLLFYAEVLEKVGKHGEVFIKELGGKSNFKTKLETFITPYLLGAKASIGFILDADKNPGQTRASLERQLSELTGQIVVDGKWTDANPKIGLLVVPGEGVAGEIETLVWHSWANDPANRSKRKCIEDYVNCMKGAEASAHSPDKGLIGALLSIVSDEDPRLGPGTRDGAFDLNRPELVPLKDFLAGF